MQILLTRFHRASILSVMGYIRETNIYSLGYLRLVRVEGNGFFIEGYASTGIQEILWLRERGKSARGERQIGVEIEFTMGMKDEGGWLF